MSPHEGTFGTNVQEYHLWWDNTYGYVEGDSETDDEFFSEDEEEEGEDDDLVFYIEDYDDRSDTTIPPPGYIERTPPCSDWDSDSDDDLDDLPDMWDISNSVTTTGW